MNTELKKLKIEGILIRVQMLSVRSHNWYFFDKLTLSQSNRYDKLIRKAAANMIINLQSQ